MPTRRDPVTRELFASSLRSVAEEMTVALVRSSYSSVIREMLDCACAVFDSRGRLIAQGDTIPVQLGFMGEALAAIREKYPREDLRPKDVYIVNDPYHGGSHTPDIEMFSPIFQDGALLGFAGTVAHHVDVGGTLFGTENPFNTELYQEGVVMPPLRIHRSGRPNQELLELLLANVREPKSTAGDLRAQLAALRLGARRTCEVAQRFGSRRFSRLVDSLLDYSERLVRAELETLPDGRYEAEGFLDDDGIDLERRVRIRVRVDKAGSDLRVDFAGSNPQVQGAINMPLATTNAAVYYVLRCLLNPDIPTNEGCYRPLTITAPAGSVVNPRPPAAVSVRHLTAQRVADTLLRALAPMVPQRSLAGCCVGFPTIGGEGRFPQDGGYHIFQDILGGGCGASWTRDGVNGVDVHLSNCGLLWAEVGEAEYLWRMERLELVPDSGGPGSFRGGLGMRRDYRLLVDEALVALYGDQGRPETAPWGLAGGGPGGLARVLVNPDTAKEQEIPLKSNVRLRKGDVIAMISPGGGGVGDPFLRDPRLVLNDVLDGYVSPAAAARDYGVVMDVRNRRLDGRATRRLREKRPTMRGRRPAK